jgi:hydrogenase maturation protease
VSGRVLVAGVGNIFLGDDGFGVEVARRLADEELPEGVRVADFGIRGVHLAYELLDGYDTAILVDATPRGGPPGTVYVIEPEPPAAIQAGDPAAAPLMDAHAMEPDAVLGLLDVLGGSSVRVLVVGCEPAEVTERIGLSEPVERAVDDAVQMVRELLDKGGTA